MTEFKKNKVLKAIYESYFPINERFESFDKAAFIKYVRKKSISRPPHAYASIQLTLVRTHLKSISTTPSPHPIRTYLMDAV